MNVKTFFTIILSLTTMACNLQKQNSTETDTEETITTDTTYLLGNYLINPTAKTVSNYEIFGFSDGDLHGEGYRYVPDSTIIYDSTTLYIIGNQIVFKEHIERDPYSHYIPPHYDFNSLKVIYVDEEHLICRDKNYLYRQEYLVGYETIKLSGYKMINDYIYLKNNALYFLSAGFELKKVEGVTLDVPTLKHLKNNYFTDKNGLYLLGGYSYIENQTSYGYDKSVQLEKSNGKKITPIVTRNYIVYNGKVYSPAQYSEHKSLPLNADRMKEFEVHNYYDYRICFLADDNHTFECKKDDGYSATNFDFQSFEERYQNEFFRKNVNQWQILTEGDMDFIKEDNGKTLYFPSEIKHFGGEIQSHVLVKTLDGFYVFNRESGINLQKIDKVFIFNFDAKKYEELDASQYRYLAENLRIYKNCLYGNDGLPIKELIDTENLHFITWHNTKTNYLTDGTSLIFIGRMGGFASRGKDVNRVQVLGEGQKRIIQGVDFTTLKVITPDILIDKDNIYNGNYDGVGVIPIKALGIDVQIFTEG